MNKTKKVLITMLVLGALATVGAGTYATFTAQTQNGGNSFATGTLLLSNTVNAATTCYSAGVASGTILSNNTNTTGCTQVVALSAQTPGSHGLAGIVVKNTGSLTPSTFQYDFSGGCTDNTGSYATTHGSGSLCGAGTPAANQDQLYFLLNEMTSTTVTTSTTITASSSVPATLTLSGNLPNKIPAGGVVMLNDGAGHTQTLEVASAYSTGLSLSVVQDTANATYTGATIYVPSTCDYGAISNTASGDTHACTFDDSQTYSNNPPYYYNGQHLVTSLTTLTGGLGTGSSRYFAFGVKLVSAADNTMQGLSSSFNLTWQLNQ